ncbi:unnamed protein product [[Candida] boidinii]|nr:unnamed protein product [[Candida] boidinii]
MVKLTNYLHIHHFVTSSEESAAPSETPVTPAETPVTPAETPVTPAETPVAPVETSSEEDEFVTSVVTKTSYLEEPSSSTTVDNSTTSFDEFEGVAANFGATGLLTVVGAAAIALLM